MDFLLKNFANGFGCVAMAET